MSQSQATKNETNRTRRSRLVWIGLLAALLVTGGAVAASLVPAHGHRGFGHWGAGGDRDPEAMRERVGFAVAWALSRVDATPEQQQQVEQIVARTTDALADLGVGHRERHGEVLALLAADDLDRDRLEAIRSAEMARVDAMSAAVTQALGELADVLTPEQRAALLERAMRHHH